MEFYCLVIQQMFLTHQVLVRYYRVIFPVCHFARGLQPLHRIMGEGCPASSDKYFALHRGSCDRGAEEFAIVLTDEHLLRIDWLSLKLSKV